jgi:ABC-type lipopolysaccharide export system ATPase subunit
MSSAVLSAHNLRKKYKARTVVTDVSFEVAPAKWSACSAPTALAKPPAST